MNEVPRLERIRGVRARMQEIERGVDSFRDALRESNDPDHQAIFPQLLERIDAIVRNERDGITTALADDLAVARSALRRLPVSDIDPELDGPTRARKLLRGERGNLVEALDNALEAVRGIGLEPAYPDFGELQVERHAYAAELIRLDERLRAVQESLDELRRTEGPGRAVVDPHARALEVEVRAARFETRLGAESAGLKTDVAALVRAIEAMRDIATDLRETVDGLGGLMAEGIRNAGRAVGRAADRSWRGMRTVVSLITRRQAGRRPAPPPQPPPDFDLDKVYKMILVGVEPFEHWRPWVTKLEFRSVGTLDLWPLAVLTNLETLVISGARLGSLSALSGLDRLTTLRLDNVGVDDLSFLAPLTSLRELSLSQALVEDIAPLAALRSLRLLILSYTPVRDISPLKACEALEILSLSGTRIEEFSPLERLSALRTLYLTNTNISDLRPLSGLTELRRLDLNATNVVDLWPLSGLRNLEELSLMRTSIYDVAALATLDQLKRVELDRTDVVDLSPLAGLPRLESITVDNKRRRNQLAPTLGARADLLRTSEL